MEHCAWKKACLKQALNIPGKKSIISSGRKKNTNKYDEKRFLPESGGEEK